MPAIVAYALPIALLIGSNVFMTTAWYWHMRYKEVPLHWVILISWALAFFEYCLAVPANRYGSNVYDPAQLKTIQEIVTLSVFAVFSTV
ncbi:MAG: DMT family protein, partial [Pseudolabrys sp.]